MAIIWMIRHSIQAVRFASGLALLSFLNGLLDPAQKNKGASCQGIACPGPIHCFSKDSGYYNY